MSDRPACTIDPNSRVNYWAGLDVRSWFETEFKPDGWATLEIGQLKFNDPDEESWKLVRGWLSGLAKITRQHIFDQTRRGIQTKSFDRRKLHFHTIYRFENERIQPEAIEAYWMYKVKLAMNKGVVNRRLNEERKIIKRYLETKDYGLLHEIRLINLNTDHRSNKHRTNYYCEAYDWKSLDDPNHNGTVLPYCNDPYKHDDWQSLIGCSGKYGSRSCRKGRCRHRL